MNRRKNFIGVGADIKIDPENIKRMVNDKLNTDLLERRMYMKYKVFKTAAMAAALTAAFSITAFAVSPAGQEAIGRVISYFESDKAEEITDIEELTKYNEEIGTSASKNGYTFTLDNVAADDNFVHVFYTLTCDKPMDNGIYSQYSPLYMDCRINGFMRTGNHSSEEGYFVDDHTWKGVYKYNVSTMDIPDTFKLELYTEFADENGEYALDDEYLYQDYLELTDADKEKLLYVSAEIDKSAVRVATKTVEVNKPFEANNCVIDKVIFSPFGNQLMLTTMGNEHSDIYRVDQFALCDENGKFLDVLNTDLAFYSDRESNNSFEFLKADADTEQISIVPVIFNEPEGDVGCEKQRIGTYPMTFEVSDNGKVVVTDIRISDGRVDIDYYKDGFVMYDPDFVLVDDDGNNAEPGGKTGCMLKTTVHYDTDSYTASYIYYLQDESGAPIPAGEEVSAAAIAENFTTLEGYRQDYIDLDFDNAVTIDLK